MNSLEDTKLGVIEKLRITIKQSYLLKRELEAAIESIKISAGDNISAEQKMEIASKRKKLARVEDDINKAEAAITLANKGMNS